MFENAITLSPMRGTEERLAERLAPAHHGDAEAAANMVNQTRDFLANNPRADPWGAYLAWNGDEPLGTCAFKSAPNASGSVEIAYATFPAHQGKGVAKAMITELSEIAFRAGAACVVARALPERNASNSALQARGFENAGEVIDPKDGPVWEWRLPAPSAR